jgi:hypothetical protein
MNLGVSSHLHGHTVVKDQRPLPLIPRASRRGFERTGRTQRFAADAASRRGTRIAPGLFIVLVGVRLLAGDRARLSSILLGALS